MRINRSTHHDDIQGRSDADSSISPLPFKRSLHARIKLNKGLRTIRVFSAALAAGMCMSAARANPASPIHPPEPLSHAVKGR